MTREEAKRYWTKYSDVAENLRKRIEWRLRNKTIDTSDFAAEMIHGVYQEGFLKKPK